MATQGCLQVVTLLSFVTGISAWRCAKYRHYFSQQPDYIDCLWDCCGNSFNRHCCAPIGIIVGCSIVGAVVVAALTVLFICWWQRRKARTSKGPKLFHNRRHSHYPVAPTSVTRPAPQLGPPPQRAGYPPYPMGGPGGPPPQQQFRPRPMDGYRAPPEQSYDSDRERRYRTGPPPQGHNGPPPQGYNGPPPQNYRGPPPQVYNYNEKPPLSSDSERDEAGPLPEKQPPSEFFM